MNERVKINSLDEFKNSLTNDSNPNSKEINAIFNEVDFVSDIKIIDKDGIRELNFTNCVFEESLTVHFTGFKNVNFSDCTFKKRVKFDESYFTKKVRFYRSEFREEVSFNNTKFDDLADFWAVTFCKKTIFYKSDFNGTTVFSYSKFNENVLFTYTLFDKLVIFKSTTFQKGLDLSLALILGKISIYNIRIEDFQTNYTPEDELEEFHKMVAEDASIPIKNKRETFRILKSHFNSNGNYIDSRKFAALEFKAYYHYLSNNIFKKGKASKNLQNYIILLFNWISNKNGNSWVRGIFFTVFIGLIFFYLSIITTENYSISLDKINSRDFSECSKYFLVFLNPTHSTDYLLNENPSTYSYFWDFIGRIFVSYGIYQTILAFRKYRK